MYRLFLFVLAFLLAPSLRAGITIDTEVEPHEPIIATVTLDNVPEGAKIRGSVTLGPGAWWHPGPQTGTYHIWAKPGTHAIVATGIWVQTRDVEINGEMLSVLVDFGQYNYQAIFKVKEDQPPDPPPPPPGERWGLIIEETSQRTPAQARLWLEARQSIPADRLIIVDRDTSSSRLRPFINKLNGQSTPIPLPAFLLISVDREGREEANHAGPCPGSLQEIKELLGLQ